MTIKEIATIVTAAARATLLVAFPSGGTPDGADVEAMARAIGNNAAQAMAIDDV